jgi:hypothetical protein
MKFLKISTKINKIINNNRITKDKQWNKPTNFISQNNNYNDINNNNNVYSPKMSTPKKINNNNNNNNIDDSQELQLEVQLQLQPLPVGWRQVLDKKTNNFFYVNE